MKTHIFIPLIIATLAFSSCEKTIDASTPDTLEESVRELTKNMTEEEKNTLLAELMVISIYVDGDEKAFLECIDGMTISEIKTFSEEVKEAAKKKFTTKLKSFKQS